MARCIWSSIPAAAIWASTVSYTHLEAQDPIIEYRKQLIEAGLATEEDCDAIIKTVDDAIFRNFKLAINDEISPRMDLTKNPDEIADMMFTNGHVEAFSDAEPDVNMPMRCV